MNDRDKYGWPQYLPGVGEDFELAQQQWGRNPNRRVTAAAPSRDKGSESCRVP